MPGVVSRSVATPVDPPWRQCHAATILVSRTGELLCSWFAGEKEGAIDNAIWLARGTREGDGWTFGEPERMSRDVDAHWNPVLGAAPDGRISLFYKVGSPISRWRTFVRRSEDGRDWTRASEVVPGDVGGRGPVKNPPIVMGDGTWVAPASVESAESPGRAARWDSFVDISGDGGVTWQSSERVPIDHATFDGAGIIQPTLWIGRDGRLIALMRSTAGAAWRAASDDGGRTWSPAERTGLPNNNSGLCALSRPDGAVICAHNTSDISWGPRSELVLSVSDDDGLTWDRLYVIDRLPAADDVLGGDDEGVVTTGSGELSYPTLVEDPADPARLLVSYTCERRSIVVATLQL